MQNPITVLATQSTAKINPQQKNNANARETAPTSFNQVLSKEISERRNAPSAKSTNEVENKTISQDAKKNITSQPTEIEPIAEDKEKNEVSLAESDQTDGVQLIALVESLAQFSQINSDKSLPPTKSDTSAIGDKTIPSLADKASQNISLSEQAANYPTKTNAIASIDAAQLSDSSGIKLPVDLKIDPKVALKTDVIVPTVDPKIAVKSDAIVTPVLEPKVVMNSDAIATSSIVPKATLADDLKTAFTLDPKAPAKDAPKTALSTEASTDPKVELKTIASTDLISVLKTELKISPPTENKDGVKIDAKQDLKSDLQSDLKIDSKPNFKTDLKIQETTNFKEQSLKVIETAPVTQSFAQQIAATSAQINATSEVTHLAPRVGSPAWNQSVGQKIVWMVAGGEQTAELTLNPPDLGPMQIVLSVNNDQANATFISAHPDVRDALESAMPKLRQMMSDAGVQLSGFSVKSDSSNPGAQFTGDQSSSRSKNSAASTVSEVNSNSTKATSIKPSSGSGIVDTFA